MGLLDELDRLKRAQEDGEIRLKSIQAAVEQIDKEIAILAPRKLELERNIEFNKKSDAAPIIHEYRKTKSELSKVTARLILIRSDYAKAKQACKDVEEILTKFRKDHADLLKTSENNVLRVIFGADRGKR